MGKKYGYDPRNFDDMTMALDNPATLNKRGLKKLRSLKRRGLM